MARGGGEWGINKAARGKWVWGCSYKKTTLIVCSINIVVALYVLRSLYASVYIYSDRDSHPSTSLPLPLPLICCLKFQSLLLSMIHWLFLKTAQFPIQCSMHV